MTNVIYNPITGIVPSKIESMSDLQLQKDNSMNSNDFNKLLLNKKNERDNLFNNSVSKKNDNFKNNNDMKIMNVDRTNYIQTFEELKNPQKRPVQQSQPSNVLNQLKDLGIIN